MREKRAKVTGKLGRLGKMDGGAKVQIGGKRVFFEVFFGFWVRCETFFLFFCSE